MKCLSILGDIKLYVDTIALLHDAIQLSNI